MAGENKNILLVDDEPKILEVVFSALESHGFHVSTAEKGRRALEIFEKENLSLVLLEHMLPDIPGEELCALLYAKNSAFPIIVLTAKVDEEDVLKGLCIGADDYIPKLFSLKVLRIIG